MVDVNACRFVFYLLNLENSVQKLSFSLQLKWIFLSTTALQSLLATSCIGSGLTSKFRVSWNSHPVGRANEIWELRLRNISSTKRLACSSHKAVSPSFKNHKALLRIKSLTYLLQLLWLTTYHELNLKADRETQETWGRTKRTWWL